MAKTQSKRCEEPVSVSGEAEGVLIERHLEGDASALRELMRMVAVPIYGYLVRCGVADTERDDLFQDIFTKVHQGASRYQPSRPFKPWLFTIVANTVRSHFRVANRRASIELSPILPPPAVSKSGPMSILEARETARWIERELAKLPMSQREVMILTCIEQMALKDVAEALNIPLNTVKTHLCRGRLTLARALARRKSRIEREVST